MIYVNSETILNNDLFFSPYIAESYPHHRRNSINNYLFALFDNIRELFLPNLYFSCPDAQQQYLRIAIPERYICSVLDSMQI